MTRCIMPGCMLATQERRQGYRTSGDTTVFEPQQLIGPHVTQQTRPGVQPPCGGCPNTGLQRDPSTSADRDQQHLCFLMAPTLVRTLPTAALPVRGGRVVVR